MGCTYCAIGEFAKGSSLREGSSGAGEWCGEEGEGGEGVLHFWNV